MAFSIGAGSGSDEIADLNVIPLIDVMLVLLILFIVTIPVQTHAVKLDMPCPDCGDWGRHQDPVVVDLGIDFDGTVIWNGSPIPDRETLRSYFQSASKSVPQPEIHFRPNRLARYERVAQVLADAQSIGVQRIGFVGTGEFAD
jgi:biopolymer transport protein ExbD